jgi:hypothetical protein
MLETKTFVTLDPAIAGNDATSRSNAVAPVLARLNKRGVIDGWRDELFPVNSSYGEPPALFGRKSGGFVAGHTRVRRAY